jgi:DNA-directed RNA polymerase subunit RPC12/RpoP
MVNNRHTGRLILAPRDTLHAPDPAKVLRQLQELAFIGQPIERQQGCAFLIGDAFLSLITFMGCSPHIQLSPVDDGGPFCYLRLEGPYASPHLLHGRNTQPPRCENCRGRIAADWRNELADWEAAPLEPSVNCQRCGHRQRPSDLQWKQSAGFARLYLAVEDIFPGEAAPTPSLLNALKKNDDADWGYFYIQD